MRHASLVGEEGRQVDRLRAIILRVSLALATNPLAAFLGQETQVSVPRGREFTMRLLGNKTRTKFSLHAFKFFGFIKA